MNQNYPTRQTVRAHVQFVGVDPRDLQASVTSARPALRRAGVVHTIVADDVGRFEIDEKVVKNTTLESVVHTIISLIQAGQTLWKYGRLVAAALDTTVQLKPQDRNEFARYAVRRRDPHPLFLADATINAACIANDSVYEIYARQMTTFKPFKSSGNQYGDGVVDDARRAKLLAILNKVQLPIPPQRSFLVPDNVVPCEVVELPDGAITGEQIAGMVGGKVMGATIGSAIGTLIPVPVVGTLLGNVIGSTIGGAIGGQSEQMGFWTAITKQDPGQTTWWNKQFVKDQMREDLVAKLTRETRERIDKNGSPFTMNQRMPVKRTQVYIRNLIGRLKMLQVLTGVDFDAYMGGLLSLDYDYTKGVLNHYGVPLEPKVRPSLVTELSDSALLYPLRYDKIIVTGEDGVIQSASGVPGAPLVTLDSPRSAKVVKAVDRMKATVKRRPVAATSTAKASATAAAASLPQANAPVVSNANVPAAIGEEIIIPAMASNQTAVQNSSVQTETQLAQIYQGPIGLNTEPVVQQSVGNQNSGIVPPVPRPFLQYYAPTSFTYEEEAPALREEVYMPTNVDVLNALARVVAAIIAEESGQPLALEESGPPELPQGSLEWEPSYYAGPEFDHRESLDCTCDECIAYDKGNAFFTADSTPTGSLFKSSLVDVSVARLPPDVYGRTFLRTFPFRIEIADNATPARQEAALTHELLHVIAELHKFGISHEQLHSLAVLLTTEVIPALTTLRSTNQSRQ